MISVVITTVVLDGLIIAANIIEMALLISKWKRLDRIEHLLFSLCIADLSCGCSMFGQDVFQLNYLVARNKFNVSSDVGMFLDCLVIFFILVSTFHVTAIAIERIVAVSMPLKYSLFTTYTCKVFTISFVWSSALVLAPSIILINRFTPGHTPGQLILAVSILSTCVILFISYMLLAWLLIRRQREMKRMLEPEMRNQKYERRTTLFCLVFGFTFLACMLPYAIGLFDANLFHFSQILLVTTYHLINPLIFFVKTSGDNTRGRSGTILSSASNLITRSPNLRRAMTMSSVNRQSASVMQTFS